MRTSLMLLALAVLGGCSSKLETGYEPRKLGASETERRGFYAGEFSPEARKAANDRTRDAEFDARRPRPGY